MNKAQIIYGSLIVVFLGIIIYSGLYFYDYLGGNKPIKVYSLGDKEILVAGREFKGKQTSEELEKFYTETRQLLLDSTFRGSLAVVTYQDTLLKSNELRQFIGIATEGDMAEIPMGYEVRQFECTNRLSIFLSMHPIVMPSANTIDELFEKRAQELRFNLQNFTIEFHYPDNSMLVEAWANGRTN